jgi:hypothetical protein
MKKLLALLIGFFVCFPFTTHASTYFLGGGMQIGALGRAPGPSSGCMHNTIDFHSLHGGEISGGRFGNIWMLYSGFRFGQARDVRNSPWGIWESVSKWTTYQFLIGGRVHVARTNPNPVKPCFGIALTYGWTRYNFDYTNPDFDIDESSASGYSKGGLGALMEFGLMIDIKGPVSPFILGQFHSFAADFDKDVYTRHDENRSMVEYSFTTGIFVDLITNNSNR